MEKFKMSSEYELYHYGIPGMKWYIRRFQNPDGSLTELGKLRYRKVAKGTGDSVLLGKDYRRLTKEERKKAREERDKKNVSVQKRKLTIAKKDFEKQKQALENEKASLKKEKEDYENKNKNPESIKNKNIYEMDDSEIRRYIDRMNLEKTALNLKKEVENLNPKTVEEGKSFSKNLADDYIKPWLRKNGEYYLKKVAEAAIQKMIDGNKEPDKYEQAKKEADYYRNQNDIDRYKKEMEKRQSGDSDKYAEAKKEAEYTKNLKDIMANKKQYNRLAEELNDSDYLKDRIKDAIDDHSTDKNWRLDYDKKSDSIITKNGKSNSNNFSSKWFIDANSKPKLSSKQISKAKDLRSNGKTIEEIAKALGVSLETAQRYISGN